MYIFTGGLPIPAWAIIVAVALANLIVGGILYAVMYRFVLSKDVSSQNSYTPARTMEDSYVAWEACHPFKYHRQII